MKRLYVTLIILDLLAIGLALVYLMRPRVCESVVPLQRQVQPATGPYEVPTIKT